jgi:hypothetical protein
MSDFEPKPDDGNYQYEGIPLTAAIAQVLIRKLFAGKLVERQILVDEVMRVHLAGGGLKSSAQDVNSSVFKKALGDMKESGAAENTSVGYWRIHQSLLAEDNGSTLPAESFLTPETSAPELSVSLEPVADVEVGTGTGAIYVYYLPTYRLRAQEQGEKAWPCKIGRTDRDPLSRVLSQAATALPERPRVAIIIRTSHPSAWESALHGVLTLRGLQIKNVPGVEWFLTSPKEILDLVKVFDPKMLNPPPNTDAIASLEPVGN